jgi:hypothetical protein
MNKAIIPKVMTDLNWTSQKITITKFKINKTGNAKPKNAGNHNNAGDRYFAETENNKQTIMKYWIQSIILLNQDNFLDLFKIIFSRNSLLDIFPKTEIWRLF